MSDTESIAILLNSVLREHNYAEYSESDGTSSPFNTIARPKDNLSAVEVETPEGKKFLIQVEEATKEKSWNYTLTETHIKNQLKAYGYTDEQLAKLDMEVIASQVLEYIEFDVNKNIRLSANNFRENNQLWTELPELDTLEDDQ